MLNTCMSAALDLHGMIWVTMYLNKEVLLCLVFLTCGSDGGLTRTGCGDGLRRMCLLNASIDLRLGTTC